jgi:hypothetical protein
MCVTEQKKTFNTRVMNISQGGVQLSAPILFQKGDRLYMEIGGYMNGINQNIKVVGLVVYTAVSADRDMLLGLQFVSNLSIPDSKFLQQYIRTMLGG